MEKRPLLVVSIKFLRTGLIVWYGTTVIALAWYFMTGYWLPLVVDGLAVGLGFWLS